MLAAPLRIACLAILVALVVTGPRDSEAPAADDPPDVVRSSTTTELAGKVYLKLDPCADSVATVGAIASFHSGLAPLGVHGTGTPSDTAALNKTRT